MWGWPPRVTKAGMMLCMGRLPPATWLGWPGVVTKPMPRLCSAMPVPGTTTPEPKPLKLDWMNDTMRPSLSAVHRYTVPPLPGWPAGYWPARCGSMSAARWRR